ncbi:MAG: response regulator [Nitriliruptorales bacterium]|nr:response regulator [Nitriliruptorales bacterium]
MAGEHVLVVDDDPDVRVFLEVTLDVAGYELSFATNGEEAVQVAIEGQPDLVLMDVMMPHVDGLEALRRLRLDGRVSHIPVILVTAKAQGVDKVEGLAAGADDYVTKPFDPQELVARVEATLRRSQQMRTVSPLTGLPGNARIEQELARRIDASEKFAMLYADLNQFKAYNDHYGFMRGDDVIRGLAEVIVEVVSKHGGGDTFVGHIGGDDFIVVTAADEYEPIAQQICERFDALAPEFYDPEDLRAGHIEVEDRQGNVKRFGLVSVSIGIAHNLRREFTHQSQPVAVATEMKTYAKQASGGMSNWAVDRRGTGNRPLLSDDDGA